MDEENGADGADRSTEEAANGLPGLPEGEPRNNVDPPLPEASDFAEASADGPEASAEGGRIVAGRGREAVVRRTGGRKLFDEAAKQVFLEWFAATCNAGWAAERAGFNYQTVWKHRMKDPAFADDYDRAEEQAVARLRSKRLETKRKPLKIGVEGDWDAPEMDDIDPILSATLLREHDGKAGRPRKVGRTPRVASNAEVRAALIKRLAAFGVRVWGEPPESPGPLHHEPADNAPHRPAMSGGAQVRDMPGACRKPQPDAKHPLGDPLISDGSPHGDPDGVAHGED